MNLFQRTIERFPELTSAGFVDVTHPDYSRLRQKLIESEAAFNACVRYLIHYAPDTCATSVGLKHDVERYCNGLLYVPQGCAIAACIVDGVGRIDGQVLRYD
ncbi:hypothetical protein Pan44_35420 [Caulifigura coniformis]|uniref:Uncharacterized protein n=1 Tax=Caulifigura coniformis TaxID=2527983 RepID=A0A517SH90_9PLAN|nr:hypothetical protein [Caulifigura coniformis]QDT55498.1 hypothetical protein Pan44_35420 [Caulifigura coniformis]